MKNSLKNKLKNQYENLSETPSKNVWESIDNELNNIEDTKFVSERRFSYWKIAAVFLILISLGFLLKISFKNNSNIIENQIVKKQNSVSEPNHFDGTKTLPSEKSIKNFDSNNPQNQNLISNRLQEKVFVKEDVKVEKSHINLIEKKSELNLAHNQNSEIQKQDSPKIFKKQDFIEIKNSVVNKQIIAENIKVKEKTKYITAEDLLFEREASKTLKEQENNQKNLGTVTNLRFQKPKEIRILGVTVYSDEKE